MNLSASTLSRALYFTLGVPMRLSTFLAILFLVLGLLAYLTRNPWWAYSFVGSAIAIAAVSIVVNYVDHRRSIRRIER